MRQKPIRQLVHHPAKLISSAFLAIAIETMIPPNKYFLPQRKNKSILPTQTKSFILTKKKHRGPKIEEVSCVSRKRSHGCLEINEVSCFGFSVE